LNKRKTKKTNELLVFTVWLIEIDWDVISSSINGQLLLLLLLLIFHDWFIFWSWIHDKSASDIFSEEISFPLPESGESLEKSCWLDVSLVEIELIKVENKDEWRSKSVGRDGRL